MTTALSIITDALIEIGVVADGQDPDSSDTNLGLRRLNQLIERWSNLRLMFPVLTEISVPLTGAASYTIGPSGNIVAARPIKVLNATTVSTDGTEYPVWTYTRDQWDAIGTKDVTGGPVQTVWYEATNTNGRVHVYPKASDYTLKLDCQTLLTSVPSLTTDIPLPEGYEEALYLNLAISLAGAYEQQVSADLKQRAAGAVKVLKRTNSEPMYLSLDAALMPMDDFQIERGY